MKYRQLKKYSISFTDTPCIILSMSPSSSTLKKNLFTVVKSYMKGFQIAETLTNKSNNRHFSFKHSTL